MKCKVCGHEVLRCSECDGAFIFGEHVYCFYDPNYSDSTHHTHFTCISIAVVSEVIE